MFVCFRGSLQWWKQGATSAEWLETVTAARVNEFFDRRREEFSPEVVYRAKTLGRVRSEYQLTFVDVGLMPLVEAEVGKRVSDLIERNVLALKSRLGWDEITSAQGHWLLQTVFWLVSAKILRDKKVPSFEEIDLNDVNDVFERVAGHYGSHPPKVGAKVRREALRESARTVDQFASLSVLTTESLAHVYENTLISKETRSELGTHSTPAYLVDYILGNLSDWIEEIPENERSVFEPACGHGAFLVSAMRLLSQLLPAEKAIPSRRGPYLRRRLHGMDVDAFALELARLSLTLTDIPNPDGWDLRAEDMFVGNRLEEQAAANTIFLANPPFDAFNDKERTSYAKRGTEIVLANKAAEMLRRTLPELRPGSVFGVVVPQTLLHGAFAVDVRRFLVENFELREISLFPDKVFKFSDAESAVLVGRRLPANSKQSSPVRFRRIRERQMDSFRETYDAPNSRLVEQSRFDEAVRWDLRVPDLEEVWLALASNPQAAEFGEIGMGLSYHSKDLPAGVLTYSAEPFAGAERGFVRLEPKGLQLQQLPKPYWMNLADEAILRRRAGTTVGVPQILLNYAPVGRGPWRLKALIDRNGRPVASRFLTVRPRGYSLETLWALLNSPVANAYAYCHLGKRHNVARDMRMLPMPRSGTFDVVDSAVATYLDAAMSEAAAGFLRMLMSRVDAAVLRLYDLPIELENSLLSLFTGWQRVGVPFDQTRFLPEELEKDLNYADFVDYESDWSRTNNRRGELIDKKIGGSITHPELSELEGLQAYASYHVHRVSPRPTQVLDHLERLVLTGSTREQDG
ncbi:MAG: class I SAM-dependent DNA methyltransferase [Planctomycetaceae bacterium]